MKAKALEIRWHDTQPIFSADFHQSSPEQHRRVAHPYAKLTGTLLGEAEVKKQEKEVEQEKIWRLATAGGDKLVRLWLVRPRPALPPKPLVLVPSTSKNPAPLSTNSVPVPNFDCIGNPSVEYLATLKQHTGVVNVVRFSPCGNTLATAGDDGNILFWIPGEGSSTFGESAEEKMYEKESWRMKSMIRSRSGEEIYDIAWSPDGSKILAGSVDHTACIYDVANSQLLHTIADHTNYVQGVAWDPRDHFIATQSSDRSMHVYSLAPTATGLQAHIVGKNARMDVKHRQGGSWSNLAASSSAPKSIASVLKTLDDQEQDSKGKEKESNVAGEGSSTSNRRLQRSDSRASDSDRSESSSTRPSVSNVGGPMSGTADEPTLMDPPFRPTSSRNSSTSGSQTFTTTNTTAPSPTLTPHSTIPSHPFRSPSPAPLPAIRLPPSPTLAPANNSITGASSIPTTLTNSRLYGDANSTPFFRRLTWSTDGSLLLTPAGLFEDPYADIANATNVPVASTSIDSTSGKKKRKNPNSLPASTSAVAAAAALVAPTSAGPKPTAYIYSRSNVSKAPIAHLPGHKTTSIAIRFCPVLWELRRLKKGPDETEGDDCPHIPLGPEGVEVKLNIEEEEEVEAEVEVIEGDVGGGGGGDKGKERERERPDSLFDLPYRMVYAVATLDAVFLYDTQQAGPICMFGNLHYAPFTDLSWSPDGETLVVSSQDGYCSIIAFEPKELGTPYTKPGPHQTINFNKLVPVVATETAVASSSTSNIPALPVGQTTLALGNIPTLDLTKDSPTSSSSAAASTSTGTASGSGEAKREGEVGVDGEPPAKKQKKRAPLTFVGAIGS